MSHYKPYQAYKESGVVWIGLVPANWEVMPICRIASCNDDSLSEHTSAEEVLRYVDISAVNHADGITKVAQVPFAEAPSRARRKATTGDVVVSTVRTYLKAVAAVTDDFADCIFSTGFAILRARSSRLDPALLKWMTLNELLIQAIEAHSEGLSYPAINATELVKLKVVVPPPTEHSTIASAVDREIARIDALIAKKTRFVELLKEKRQAFITHAITKGINQKTKMKDSGVEWIGEMPEHWMRVQLGKITFQRCDGPFGSGLKSDHYVPEGVRVVRLQNIGWATFKNHDAVFISEDHWNSVLGRNHEVLPGDILIAGLGDENNPLGRACVAPENLGNTLVKADCYRFRIRPEKADSRFVALSLSATASAECGFMATGATRDRLNLGLASTRLLALPPLNEQRQIVEKVDFVTSRLDLLAEKTQRSIDLLKERRSAFITAAVTGQIDLRGAA